MTTLQFNSKILVILLWISVMLTMLFADIFSLIVEMTDGNVIDIPLDAKTMMGIAAILTNIPILMIILTWVLPTKWNKWVNVSAAIFTIFYVVGGGAMLPHYLVIGCIEIVLLILIMRVVLRWKL